MYKFLIALFLTVIVSCNSKRQSGNSISKYPDNTTPPRTLSPDSVYATDYGFLGDSIFMDLKEVLHFYVHKYAVNNCAAQAYSKKDLKANFESPLKIGNIRKDVPSSVFVLLPFQECRDPYSDSMFMGAKDYYFTDTTLPKLPTDVFCTHPSNIFLVGDIDEDGISEIGEYYSSCSSHYKSLRVWTLKKEKWVEIGRSTFDQHYMSYDRPFSSYVKKLSKGNFAMYEKTDLPIDTTKYAIGYWLKFKM